MSNARYVGKYPDHVARYTHKPNRWMNPPTTYRQTTAGAIHQNAIIALSVAVLIAVGVMILQAV